MVTVPLGPTLRVPELLWVVVMKFRPPLTVNVPWLSVTLSKARQTDEEPLKVKFAWLVKIGPPGMTNSPVTT